MAKAKAHSLAVPGFSQPVKQFVDQLLELAPDQQPAATLDGDDDASTESCFNNLTDEDGSVDISKLRTEARLGVPPSHRPRVWKVLLGIDDPLNGAIAGSRRFQQHLSEGHRWSDTNAVEARRLRADIRRRIQDISGSAHRAANELPLHLDVRQAAVVTDAPALTDRYVAVITAYLDAQNGAVDYIPDMVYLVEPFLFLYKDDSDSLGAFRALMQSHLPTLQKDQASKATSMFSMILRHTTPDVHDHLEAEEVIWAQWAPSWLRSLMAAQLPLDSVLQLWDAYFADASGLELHPYVCVAIVEALGEEIMEMDGQDLLDFLRRIPSSGLEMTQMIARAKNIRSSAAGGELL